MREKQWIGKTEEINEAISKLWIKAGALKGPVLNFYNPRSFRRAKGGILFIGTIADVFKRDPTADRFVNRDSERSPCRKEFFSQARLLARHAGYHDKWAYIDFWLGLRTKRRDFPAAKTAKEKAAANKDFVKKAEGLSFDLVKTVMEGLKPRCVVAFGKASNFLAGQARSARKSTISSHGFKKNGFHLWDNKTPVFLCYSLSRCASGDMSLERLKWHVKGAVAWQGR